LRGLFGVAAVGTILSAIVVWRAVVSSGRQAPDQVAPRVRETDPAPDGTDGTQPPLEW
jgi:hypothetical protein